jgi:hypothetical protein
MKNEALKNLESISLDEIREYIKSNNPVEYDKMIISPSEIVRRTDFMFVNYTGQSLTRTAKGIQFPMFGNVKDNFDEFSGGVSRHGEKAVINSKHIFKELEGKGIQPQVDSTSSPSDLEFPISVSNNNVDSNQPTYFLAAKTTSWTCECCSGKQYVKCDDFECDGRHNWQCDGCFGKGQIVCNNCSGQGRYDCKRCNGSNKVSCSTCGGDGRVGDGAGSKIARGMQGGRQKDKFFQDKSCGTCSGRGRINCSSCNNGKVSCSTCSASGKVTCKKCSGQKSITCKKCYGDKERYGKIDCPECLATGELAKISFVETSVDTKNIQRIVSQGNNLKDLSPDSLMKFAKKNEGQVNVLKNFNDVLTKEYDELVAGYIEDFQNENGYQFNGFVNRITDEEVYFQVIPCVQIEYRHMITNTLHNATILNFFESPELVIDKSVENEKSDSKDKMKGISRFFGKLFKTATFKKKEDRKREIKLMIMLAKVDGKIEDQEKLFLAQEISGISEFTVSEKKAFFNLMDAASLPDLEKNDVLFFSDEAFQAAMAKIESLAGKDGEIEGSEKDFIEKVKSLNIEFSKPKK